MSGGLGRLERALLESLMPKDKAIAWAEQIYEHTARWPRRRFRLEGALGGASRLLVEAQAARAKGRYGGKVIEVIPSRMAYCEERGIKHLSPLAQAAADLDECPHCHVLAGEPCVRPNGMRRWPHGIRR